MLSKEDQDQLFKFMISEIESQFTGTYKPLDSDLSLHVSDSNGEYRVHASWTPVLGVTLLWVYYFKPTFWEIKGKRTISWSLTTKTVEPDKQTIQDAVSKIAGMKKDPWEEYQKKLGATIYQYPCYFCAKATTVLLPSRVPSCADCILRHVKPFFVAD